MPFSEYVTFELPLAVKLSVWFTIVYVVFMGDVIISWGGVVSMTIVLFAAANISDVAFEHSMFHR